MDARPAVLLATAAALGFACGSQPVGLTAQTGSTFALAVTGEVTEGAKLGYGGLAGSTPVYDDQRGELRFALKPVGGGAEVELPAAMVTRVLPDPASDVALTNGAILPAVGIAQPVALIHLEGVPAGTYDIEVRRRRRTSPTQWQTFLPGPESPFNQPRRLSVLPAFAGSAGAPTPFQGLYRSNAPVDTTPYVPSLYPHPKVVVGLGAAPPAAAHLVVDYPEAKMQVLGVIEEQHFGRSSIVAYQDDVESGELTIDFADPEASVRQLAIVFELLDPFGAGRVSALGDFALLPGTRLYDANGAVIQASVAFGPIR